ncbi:MAG: glycosyltransferase family 4 protein [Vicinamibacterales bacterium]
MTAPSPPPARRVLLCGPVFPALGVGGLPLALADVARALEARGWSVDLAITPDALGLDASAAATTVVPRWTTRRWAWTPRFAWLPSRARTLFQHALGGGGVAATQSAALHALDARLRRERYDAVIAHLHQPVPGIARFATARHPAVLLTSLDALAGERALARWLWIPRALGRLRRRRFHPDLYRPVDPRRLRAVAFGSGAWRDEAVARGVPAGVTRVIPFGVPRPRPLREPASVSGRLLWVGRLSPEKGLHVFLDAVAALRTSRPVTLTAICGAGPDRYRDAIERQIAALGLTGAVRLLRPVTRTALGGYYASHDALLFHSCFREPVALVLMEAFAAGLPVVAPERQAPGGLIEPDATCVCFPSDSPPDVSAAIARALDDDALRRRVRAGAHATVTARASFDAMGDAYDAVLRELTGAGPDHPPAPGRGHDDAGRASRPRADAPVTTPA